MEGDRVLDIGCGIGTLGKEIAEKNKGVEVFFSDISPVAGEYLEGLNFTCCPAEKTPFPDEYFDKVYCLHTISHVTDREKTVRELLRITKKGGILAMIGPNKHYATVMKMALSLGLIPPYNIDKTAKWLITPSGITKLLTKSGWHVIKIMYFGQHLKKTLPLSFLRLRVLAIAKK